MQIRSIWLDQVDQIKLIISSWSENKKFILLIWSRLLDQVDEIKLIRSSRYDQIDEFRQPDHLSPVEEVLIRV